MPVVAISLDPKITAAIDWLIDAPFGKRISTLRWDFGLNTQQILAAWRIASTLRVLRKPA